MSGGDHSERESGAGRSATTTREEVEGRPARTYEVASLTDAIELARGFKAAGTYDCFRGQVGPWVPHSSLFRRFMRDDRSEHDHAIRRTGWLRDWVRTTPALSHTLASDKAYEFLAIAQHYGIPTNLIDFTTDPDVAAFFASDAPEPPVGGTACIYCLDSRSIEKVWTHAQATRERAGTRLEIVRIDVENLWRLKAQRGVFVHANYNWEIDYPLDRILFPYSGSLAASRRSRIYPEDKSGLELLLDQHFEREIYLEMAAAVGQFVNHHAPGSTVNLVSTSLHASNANVFKDGTPEQLPSWDAEALSAWHAHVVEEYDETVGGDVRTLELPDHEGADTRRRLVRREVERLLHAEPDLRLKAVTWDVRGLPGSIPAERVRDALRSMWNGTRRLPYTNEEIAECAASVVVLLAAGFWHGAGEHERRTAFAVCFGESFLAGLANDDGSPAHGHVNRAALLQAVRPDLNDLLRDPYGDDLEKLFASVDDPKLMFEFPFLRERFVRELIPSQVALERDHTIFNPAKLAMFGNP